MRRSFLALIIILFLPVYFTNAQTIRFLITESTLTCPSENSTYDNVHGYFSYKGSEFIHVSYVPGEEYGYAERFYTIQEDSNNGSYQIYSKDDGSVWKLDSYRIRDETSVRWDFRLVYLRGNSFFEGCAAFHKTIQIIH